MTLFPEKTRATEIFYTLIVAPYCGTEAPQASQILILQGVIKWGIKWGMQIQSMKTTKLSHIKNIHWSAY